MSETIDCKSDEGIIIGMLDGIMAQAEAINMLLDKFGISEYPEPIREALKDFAQDNSILALQACGSLIRLHDEEAK
jgi:hypothetical protein